MPRKRTPKAGLDEAVEGAAEAASAADVKSDAGGAAKRPKSPKKARRKPPAKGRRKKTPRAKKPPAPGAAPTPESEIPAAPVEAAPEPDADTTPVAELVAEPVAEPEDAALEDPTPEDVTSEDAKPVGGPAVDHAEAVELSPEEALALLAELGRPDDGDAEPGAPDAPPVGEKEAAEAEAAGERRDEAPALGDDGLLASILGASCRVLTFEGAGVEEDMRVAQAAVTRLREYVRDGGLAVSVGPICRTLAEFVAEWDNTPSAMPVAIVANLRCAGAFLPAIVEERPRVASAYWIVFETLRSELSTATSDFLAELRSRNRLRAIGFGPRNMMSAARGGAEAVRGHVEWGFGRGPVSVAG